MSSTSAPFGLRPISHVSGYGTRGSRAIPGGIATGYATAIYENQPVKFATDGTIAPVSATSDDFIGVFVGVEWTDSEGRRKVSNRWTASTAGTEIIAYVVDDPNMEYEIQADGSLAQTALMDQLNFTNLSSGSTVTGFSSATANATPVGAGNQGQLRVVGLGNAIDNAWGDSYTVVRVQVARHQSVSNKVAV
jgi:hypothetical protein